MRHPFKLVPDYVPNIQPRSIRSSAERDLLREIEKALQACVDVGYDLSTALHQEDLPVALRNCRRLHAASDLLRSIAARAERAGFDF